MVKHDQGPAVIAGTQNLPYAHSSELACQELGPWPEQMQIPYRNLEEYFLSNVL